MIDINEKDKKKILILGGTIASLDIVLTSKKLGYKTYVIDDNDFSPCKAIAYKSYTISTTDFDKISELIKKESINGIFAGPGEFNLYNAVLLSELNDLQFYVSSEQWKLLTNKKSFKQICLKFGIPVIKDYTNEWLNNNLVDLPVIIKPVDSNSSKGISVVTEFENIHKAINESLKYSNEYLIEQYIDSDGYGIDARFIIINGRAYFSLSGDRYNLSSHNKISNICVLTIFPSVSTELIKNELSQKVQKMCDYLDIKNSVMFFQGLPHDNSFIFHEMGLRVSGGNIYKIIDKILSVNELEMLIKYSMQDYPFIDQKAISSLDPFLKGNYAASFQVMLRPGTISKIEGLRLISENKYVEEFVQYYYEGDIIKSNYIGTLSQIFARIKIIASTLDELIQVINFLQTKIKITDIMGENMLYSIFDTNRIIRESLRG